MGSSMVTKCRGRVRFISWMMPAMVVLFPDPVGPVTKTRPFLIFEMPRTLCGMPS